MPILFITLSDFKVDGYVSKTMKIQDYIPTKKTYYVSPANSLCFMDGGIDYALSRIVFPGIEAEVKHIVKQLNSVSIVGKPYLPIGSSIIMDRGLTSLIVAPTMLLPQNVSSTRNAYYATMAVLYNILVNRNENLDDIDIIFTSLCCGYGKMPEEESINQIKEGINDYIHYKPKIINNNIIFHEPNLYDQPKYYQNTEFFHIDSRDIIKC
jgi:O-acetyl-ADP-ribose deacetylase (regulator of RNase III)